MQDAINALGEPDALTLPQLIALADADFALFLRDRKNARRIPHRLESCGYVAVRNDGAKDGRWKVGIVARAGAADKFLNPLQLT